MLAKATNRTTLLDAYQPYLHQRCNDGHTDSAAAHRESEPTATVAAHRPPAATGNRCAHPHRPATGTRHAEDP